MVIKYFTNDEVCTLYVINCLKTIFKKRRQPISFNEVLDDFVQRNNSGVP